MNKIEFTNQKAPKTAYIINVLVVLAIILFMLSNSQVRDGLRLAFSGGENSSTFILILVIAIVFVLGVFFALFYKKTHYNFFVDDEGIGFGDKKILWSNIKNYHMLGDSQDERFGTVSSKYTLTYDVHNPYLGMNTFVIETKSGFMGSSFRLQLSKDRLTEFEQILSSKGILKESKTRMYFTGVNKWFIILFAIPFGLLVLWLLSGLYFGG